MIIKTLLSKWPVWLILAVCLYTVVACEFPSWRIITLSASGESVEKINGIAKNLSYSYIAGVVFYVLSELIPFLHKQGFVLMRLKPYVENLVVAIDDLIYGLTGCKLRDDEIKNGEGVYSLITEHDYEAEGYNQLKDNQRLAIRSFVAQMDKGLDMLLSNDVYIGNDDFVTALSLSTHQAMMIMRAKAEAASSISITNRDLLTIASSLGEMKEKILALRLLKG